MPRRKKGIVKTKDVCAEKTNEEVAEDEKKLVEGKKLKRKLPVSIDFDKLKSIPDELITQRLNLLNGIELPSGPPPDPEKPVTRQHSTIVPTPCKAKPSPMPSNVKLNFEKIKLDAIIKLMQSLTLEQWHYAVAQSQTIETVDDSAKEEYLENIEITDKPVKDECRGKSELIEIFEDSVEDVENRDYRTVVNQFLRSLAELCHTSIFPRNTKDVKKEKLLENILLNHDIEKISNVMNISSDVNKYLPASLVGRTPENHLVATNTIDKNEAGEYTTDGNHELPVEKECTPVLHSAAEMLLSLSRGHQLPLNLHREIQSTWTVSLSKQCNHREFCSSFAVTHNTRESDLSHHMNTMNVRNSTIAPFFEKGTPNPNVLSRQEENFATNALSFGGPTTSLQSTAPLLLLANSTSSVNRPRTENITPQSPTVLCARPIFEMEHSKPTPSSTLRFMRPGRPATVPSDMEHSNYIQTPGWEKAPARILKRKMTSQFQYSDPPKVAKIDNRSMSQKDKAMSRIFGSNHRDIAVTQNVMPPPLLPPQLPAASVPSARPYSTLNYSYVSRPGLYSTSFASEQTAPTSRQSVLQVQQQSNALYNSTIQQSPPFSYFQTELDTGQGNYQSQNTVRLPPWTDYLRVNTDFQHPLPRMCVPPPPSWTPAPTQFPAYKPYVVPPMETQCTLPTPPPQQFDMHRPMHGSLYMHSEQYYTPHKN